MTLAAVSTFRSTMPLSLGLFLVVGVAVSMTPVAAMVLPVALAALLATHFAPRASVGLGLCVILLTQTVAQASGISIIGFADEAVVIVLALTLCSRRLLSTGSIRKMPGTTGLVIYVVAGLLSSFTHGVPAGLSIAGAFLFVKGFLFGLACAQLEWTEDHVRTALRWAGVVIAGIVAAMMANLVLPGLWYETFASTARSDVRSGVASVIGPFVHPGPFGQVAALSLAAIVAYRNVLGFKQRGRALMVLCGIGVVLSFRRKAVVGALAAMAFIKGTDRTMRFRLAISLIAIGPAVVLLGGGGAVSIARGTYAEYVENSDKAARSVLYSGAIDIGKTDFPLGAGFSRYGSYLAGEHYSPEYVKRGFMYVAGLNKNGTFDSDTFWPAILGEAGVIGLSGYTACLFGIMTCFRRLRRTDNPTSRFLGVLGIAWMFEFLIESTASPVFASPPVFPLVFALAGVAVAFDANRADGPTPKNRAQRNNALEMLPQR